MYGYRYLAFACVFMCFGDAFGLKTSILTNSTEEDRFSRSVNEGKVKSSFILNKVTCLELNFYEKI